MVELGNGDSFFFDFGPGCLRNIISMGHSQQLVQDIFITHLHVDHYHDLSYLLPFSAWSGRYTPLRVHGPSGRTAELGTQGMIDGMKQMLKWHTEAFDVFPIGDGYEVDVNEFDWKDENGVCYEKNGVTIRHWRRSHAKDGATAYRLDWNGLSFVWTGDGRPDELTVKYSEGVDVFVTEVQTDTARIIQQKYGLPPWLYNYTIDTHHTPHYVEARAFGFDVPEWISSYFDAAAMEISRLYGAAAHGDKGSTDLRHILDALKFLQKGKMGRGSVFEKALKSDWIFYGATVQRYIRQGDKPDFAVQSCADRNNVSYSKVNRAWRKYRDRYGD